MDLAKWNNISPTDRFPWNSRGPHFPYFSPPFGGAQSVVFSVATYFDQVDGSIPFPPSTVGCLMWWQSIHIWLTKPPIWGVSGHIILDSKTGPICLGHFRIIPQSKPIFWDATETQWTVALWKAKRSPTSSNTFDFLQIDAPYQTKHTLQKGTKTIRRDIPIPVELPNSVNSLTNQH